MLETKDPNSLTVEIDRLRIRASGRFAVTMAAVLAAVLIGVRWLGFW